MRKILTFVLAVAAGTTFAQSRRFALPTPDKDTLYINHEDEVGLLTKDIWDKDKTKNKPVIILVDTVTIAALEKRIYPNGYVPYPATVQENRKKRKS